MFRSPSKQYVKAAKKDPSTAVDNVRAALDAGYADAARQIIQAVKMERDDWDLVYQYLIEKRDIDAFRLIYRQDSYRWFPGDENQIRLLQALADAGWQDAINTVIVYDPEHYNSLERMAGLPISDLPAAVIHQFIETHKRAVSAKAYLQYAAEHAPSKLLRLADIIDDGDGGALAAAACTLINKSKASGDLVKTVITRFIELGMRINDPDGEVMAAVLMADHFDLANLLAANGYDPARSGQRVADHLADNGASAEARRYIEKLCATGKAPDVKAPVEAAQAATYTVVQALPTGGQLTTIFNFALAQQILIAESKTGISAPTVVPFSQIESRDALRDAALAYVAAGGDAWLVEALVGGRGIAKTKTAEPGL